MRSSATSMRSVQKASMGPCLCASRRPSERGPTRKALRSRPSAQSQRPLAARDQRHPGRPGGVPGPNPVMLLGEAPSSCLSRAAWPAVESEYFPNFSILNTGVSFANGSYSSIVARAYARAWRLCCLRSAKSRCCPVVFGDCLSACRVCLIRSCQQL